MFANSFRSVSASLNHEFYIGALDLSPFAIFQEYKYWESLYQFMIACRELPQGLQKDLHALTYWRRSMPILLPHRADIGYLTRCTYRPLNSLIHAEGKPIFNRSEYKNEPVFFIEGAFRDASPF